MPLPFILGGIAAAGIAGVGSGISGAVKMKEADEKIKIACTHLENLYDLAHKYIEAIDNVRKEYNKNFRYIWDVINKNNKTDFMYSIILAELYFKALPGYIREGLMWLI